MLLFSNVALVNTTFIQIQDEAPAKKTQQQQHGEGASSYIRWLMWQGGAMGGRAWWRPHSNRVSRRDSPLWLVGNAGKAVLSCIESIFWEGGGHSKFQIVLDLDKNST